jgi:hypothetical protein
MIFAGTYIGIFEAIILVFFLIYTIRWQRRFGGFWPYSVILFIFLGLVVLTTALYSSLLSDSSLQHALDSGRWGVDTVDKLRPIMMARNTSQISSSCMFFLIPASLLAAVATLKAFHLERKRAATASDADAKE